MAHSRTEVEINHMINLRHHGIEKLGGNQNGPSYACKIRLKYP
jgi:hypothetical protein